MKNKIEIIQPDDWHVHFREGEMLKAITHYSSRINKRCIAMPNTETPITDSAKAGANLVLVPENVTMMEAKNTNAFIKSKLEKDHPAVPIFKQLARRLKFFY